MDRREFLGLGATAALLPILPGKTAAARAMILSTDVEDGHRAIRNAEARHGERAHVATPR